MKKKGTKIRRKKKKRKMTDEKKSKYIIVLTREQLDDKGEYLNFKIEINDATRDVLKSITTEECKDEDFNEIAIRRYLVKRVFRSAVTWEGVWGMLFSKQLLDSKSVTYRIKDVRTWTQINSSLKSGIRDILRVAIEIGKNEKVTLMLNTTEEGEK